MNFSSSEKGMTHCIAGSLPDMGLMYTLMDIWHFLWCSSLDDLILIEKSTSIFFVFLVYNQFCSQVCRHPEAIHVFPFCKCVCVCHREDLQHDKLRSSKQQMDANVVSWFYILIMGNLIFPPLFVCLKKYLFFSSFESFLSRSPIQIFKILESLSKTL